MAGLETGACVTVQSLRLVSGLTSVCAEEDVGGEEANGTAVAALHGSVAWPNTRDNFNRSVPVDNSISLA